MLEAYKNFINSLMDLVNRVRTPAKRTVNTLASRKARMQFLAAVLFAANRPFILENLAEASCHLVGKCLLAVKLGAHFADIKDEDLDIFSLNTDWSLGNSLPLRHVD